MSSRKPEALALLRRRIGALAVDSFFRGASWMGRLHPNARPERHGVEVVRDVAYKNTGLLEHKLDIYRPRDRQGPLPAVLYIHGGGFRILSKDTHWVMGLAFARAGVVVFNISYRLAPLHRYPAAVEDCAAALEWVMAHGREYGADLDRLAFAGESAGANLTSALTLMCCFPRREPHAARVFDLGMVPKAWLPYCGVLQVSDPQRFKRRKPRLNAFIDDRLTEVSEAYLGLGAAVSPMNGSLLDLADPLVVLERDEAPARPIPPCFAAVGTRDPLLDDTRRLSTVLERRGVEHEAHYYPGEMHAFHALVWRPQARRCWGHTYQFLERHLGVRGAR